MAAVGFEYGYSVACPARARPLGGPVRRLRQLRPGDRRPVHRLRPLEVAPELAADAPAPARVRGQRARALERAARALHAARRPGEHPHRQLHDRGAVLPRPPPPGSPPEGTPARPPHAQGAPAPEGVDLASSTTSRAAASARCSTTRASTRRGARRAGRLVLCSGKVYYDIVGHAAHQEAEGVAVARLEQIYPFPVAAYDELLSRYPNITELIWAQEEPQNMGAWRAIRHRLEEGLPDEVRLRYVGRPWRASPSEGYPTAHAPRAGPDRPRDACGLLARANRESPRASKSRWADSFSRPGVWS